MSLSFLLLEVCTRKLVKVSEPALAVLQKRLAARSATPELAFVDEADKPTQRFRKYSFVIRALICAPIVVMIVAALAATIEGLDR